MTMPVTPGRSDSRTSARKVYIRDTDRGPEVVWDWGTQGHYVPCTEADLGKLEAALAARRAEPAPGGYTDRAGIDSRANAALLAIDVISADYAVPAAVRLVLVAQRMAQEPILTDTGSPAAYAVREEAARYTAATRNRKA
jgi:hypothetical protein